MNRDQNHLGSRGNKKNTSRGGVGQQRKAGTRSKEKGKFRATMSSLVLLGFPPQVSTHSLAHVQGNQTTPAHPRQAKGRETSCCTAGIRALFEQDLLSFRMCFYRHWQK